MSFFSPIRPLLKGWLLSLLGWGLIGVALAAYGVATWSDGWSLHLRQSLEMWLPWAFFTPLLFRLVGRLPLDREHWRRTLPLHLVCCALIMAAGYWWRKTLHVSAAFPPPPSLAAQDGGPGKASENPEVRARPPGALPPEPPDFGGHPPGRGPGGPPRGFALFFFISFQLPIYLMLVTGAHSVLFYRREQERAASLAEARLDALRSQLQPHFFFNTINSIAGFVHDEPDKADAMLTSLSELLRMSLSTSTEHEMPLDRELEFMERYLALLHARFEDRVLFSIEADPETRTALVPPMILQAIVENAFEHGLQPKPEGGLISIRARREGGVLHLIVSDDGIGLSEGVTPSEGVGLGNTRARLRELYGERATLTLRSESEGMEVEITLPFRPHAPAVALA